MALPKIVADLETSLAAKIAVGGTTGTLVSNVDDDGVTLADGTYYFTLDGNNSAKEHIRCTKTGTALSDIYSYSRQGVATSGVVREHRVGAKVIMTDYATYKNYFEAAVISNPGGSSTDNAVVRFDSTTGQLIQNSGVIIDDSNNVYIPGTLDLGHASDTTVSRSAAGVIAVEGVVIPSISSTNTLTNKRITPRILSATSYTTDTGTSLNCDTLDQFIVTAQAGALKLNNPTGTPVDGQRLIIAITGTAARAITYDTQYEASTIPLPSTTVTTARLNLGFIWRADTSKWVLVATA